ncbi:MAG: hypothetical protein HY744_11675 [Deltaproteobacteria bacterium]|nr:hypothetical protein [Deltaproteobacteria bacterium]
MTPRALTGILALAAATAACSEDPVRRAEERATAAQQRIPLAEISSTRLSPPKPRLRVLVGASGIDVDAAGLFASWKEEDRAELLRSYPEEERAGLPFVHEQLVRIKEWRVAPPDDGDSWFIRPLGEVVAYAQDLEQRHANIAGGYPSTEVNVFIHRDAPISLVLPVFATCRSSHPIVRGPSGEVALPIQARGGCGKPRCSLSLRFGSEGITVKVHGTRALAREIRSMAHSAALEEARKMRSSAKVGVNDSVRLAAIGGADGRRRA